MCHRLSLSVRIDHYFYLVKLRIRECSKQRLVDTIRPTTFGKKGKSVIFPICGLPLKCIILTILATLQSNHTDLLGILLKFAFFGSNPSYSSQQDISFDERQGKLEVSLRRSSRHWAVKLELAGRRRTTISSKWNTFNNQRGKNTSDFSDRVPFFATDAEISFPATQKTLQAKVTSTWDGFYLITFQWRRKPTTSKKRLCFRTWKILITPVPNGREGWI